MTTDPSDHYCDGPITDPDEGRDYEQACVDAADRETGWAVEKEWDE